MPANRVRLLALVFFALSVALRFAPHGVNFNAIGALALFAGCYLSATEGALIALGALALTDTLGHWLDLGSMGYYHRPTMFAVYIATALPSLLGWFMRKYEVKWTNLFAAAVTSSALFFVITNFAAWLDPMLHCPLPAIISWEQFCSQACSSEPTPTAAGLPSRVVLLPRRLAKRLPW
jgi:hypothetical protein